MLLTITTTATEHGPATDLGYLLAKNPARTHSFELAFGRAHVVYPEASAGKCTAALLVDVDAVALARRVDRDGEPLAPYVNDRPYAASSFMSVAIAQVFGAALNGRSRERQQLMDTPLPLDVEVSVVPSRGGELLLRALFEPLGYAVEVERHALDARFPAWGESRYFTLRLRAAAIRVSDALAHLYVLVPVLDDDKHYWVGADEVDKLLRHGAGWLETHPAKDEIARRYLRRSRRLTDLALERLELAAAAAAAADVDESGADDDGAGADDGSSGPRAARGEDALEKTLSLNEQRIGAVVDALAAERVTTVIDLGCGEGRLVRALLKAKAIARVVGVDVSARVLEIAARRLRLDTMAPRMRERVELVQGSVTYRDARFAGFDAACAVEVIEHIDASRLPAFESVVFGHARPRVVVVTTPNVDYNALFVGMEPGQLRHRDHRFEWTRAQFEEWARGVARRRGYRVRFSGIGAVDATLGAPTQMAVFVAGGGADDDDAGSGSGGAA